MAEGARPLPEPTPETQHFWEGTKAGELRLQRCDDCRHTYFPPRPFCPKCGSREVAVFKASGKAMLWSATSSTTARARTSGPSPTPSRW